MPSIMEAPIRKIQFWDTVIASSKVFVMTIQRLSYNCAHFVMLLSYVVLLLLSYTEKMKIHSKSYHG